MKSKVLIWVGLIIQVAFLLFILSQAPEPHDSIKIGLERLKSNCPSEMMTGMKTPEGNWVISTAGDFFSMADNWFQFIIVVSICFGMVNLIISALLLIAIRKKKKDSSIPVT